jgi:hypothetical protein
MSTSRDATKLGFLPLGVLHVGIMNLAVLPLAVLVLCVLTLAKLGFLNCTTGRFVTGCFGVRPKFQPQVRLETLNRNLLQLRDITVLHRTIDMRIRHKKAAPLTFFL